MKNRDPIRDQLGSIELPRLPQVLVQLIDICQEKEPDIQEVAQTVAKDIAISTKTLQLANSAFLGARSQFKNIEQAVIFLGINTVRNLAISISLHGIFKDNVKKTGFNREEFWYHSMLTALVSKAISQQYRVEEPGTAYLAGLLHDTGKYVLCQHFGKPYNDFITANGQRPDLTDEERKRFKFSHCDIGKWLVESWNLSEDFSRAVENHHNGVAQTPDLAQLDTILRLANCLAIDPEAASEITEGDAKKLGIEYSQLAPLVVEQRELLEELANSLGVMIKEPDSTENGTLQQRYREELREKIETRAQLYGFMDNIIQATTMNRVFLALEESLALIFACHESCAFLPDPSGDRLIAQGSFRNQLTRALKSENFTIECDAIWSQSTAPGNISNQSRQPVALIRDERFEPIFALLKSTDLLALPLPISREKYGAIVLGVPEGDNRIIEHQEGLQLLCSHVSNRLNQEILKQEYAESFARERIAAVEDMARSIAHEISTPLAVIQNYIALLSDNEKPGKDMGEELTIINAEIKRIANISGQLNDLSSTPRQKHAEQLDINKLLSESAALFTHSLGTHSGINISYEPDDALPKVWIDPNTLKQILGNLITNSIEALENGGEIGIHCHHVPGENTESEEEIVIVVSDNGPGVDPSIVNNMFRAGKTTKSDGHAGLGLAIVNKLTKDIGGRVYHSSTSQGNTQFTLHFPAAVTQL